MRKVRAATVRPLYNDTDSDIEWKLTEFVTEPILHHLIPRSVKPNTITAVNTAVCWTLLASAFLAWHLGPLTAAAPPLTPLRAVTEADTVMLSLSSPLLSVAALCAIRVDPSSVQSAGPLPRCCSGQHPLAALSS
jgi:hypothetical protein